jgi:predicted MFS family arabinose efflux permease
VRAYGLVYWGINLGFSIGLAIAGILSSISFRLLFVLDGLSSLTFAFLVWRGVPETRPSRAPHEAHRPPAGGFFVAYRDPPFVLFLCLCVAIIVIFMQHASVFAIDVVAHGVSKPAFGTIVALNGIAIVLVQPFLTPRLARYPATKVLALGSVLVALGFGWNAIAHTVPAYMLGVLVWTIGEICVLPVSNTVIADLAPVEVRGRYQGAYGLSWGVASFLAPAAGSFVLQRFGSVPLWTGCLVLGMLVAVGYLALGPRIARVGAERRGRLATAGANQ